jgi:hypothetical protein
LQNTEYGRRSRPVQKPGEILVFLIRKETKCSEHACRKYSGRVGRSAAAKRLPEAIRLATAASVRHRFTDYDLLLLQGVDRAEARAQVYHVVQKKLEQWRSP